MERGRLTSTLNGATAATRGGGPALLSLRHVSKAFPGKLALDDIDLDLHAGGVHGLVGQNGSGKSTLIKILAGYHHPEGGAEASFDGEPFALGHAGAAEHAGMRFIHQDLGLVPTLSAVDNLALGRGYSRGGFIRLRSEARRARALLADFGFEFDVRRPVAQLDPVDRTAIAITRALRPGEDGRPPRLLVLDEPTESFGRAEVERLFDAIRRIAAQGAAILYVSHRLDEILQITDEVTVFRNGRVVAEDRTNNLDHDRLIELITGRSAERIQGAGGHKAGAVRLRAAEIHGNRIDGVTLEIRAGEVVGLAGIVGSGRQELPYLISGARPAAAGGTTVDGKLLDGSPRAALAAGLVFIPADRQGESAIPSLTVRENVTLPKLETAGPGWLAIRRERREAASWLERFDVQPPDPERSLATLSGGNQQKAVIARALRCEPGVLIIDEPVQGVDVGAKASIFNLILEAAAKGIGVLLASSEVEDLVATCNRIVVLRAGRVAAELQGEDLTAETITAESLRKGSPNPKEMA